MDNRVVRLAFMLALAGLIVVGVGAVAQAQTTVPGWCNDAKYDISGNGVYDQYDLYAWKNLFRSSRCDLGSVVGTCPAKLDLDRSGVVDRADQQVLFDTVLLCQRPQAFVPVQ